MMCYNHWWMTNGKKIEMAEKERTALKWIIGIIAFVVWVAVGRGVILSDGAGYDSMEQEWVMSAGQQWAMVL